MWPLALSARPPTHQLNISPPFRAADEPVTAWRCPICRRSVDPGGVAATELPEDACAKSWYRPPGLTASPASSCNSRRSSCDLEAGGSSSSGTGSSSSSAGAGPRLPVSTPAGSAGKQSGGGAGRLAAVEWFFCQAGAALADEEQQAESGGSPSGGKCVKPAGSPSGGKCVKPAGSSRAGAWLLAAAERVLPEPALAAAATGLAALRLRQLLQPKEPPVGLAGAVAAWAASLLFLAGTHLWVLLSLLAAAA